LEFYESRCQKLELENARLTTQLAVLSTDRQALQQRSDELAARVAALEAQLAESHHALRAARSFLAAAGPDARGGGGGGGGGGAGGGVRSQLDLTAAAAAFAFGPHPHSHLPGDVTGPGVMGAFDQPPNSAQHNSSPRARPD
ncbi:hypothetical protein HK405_011147, partial [Cladochytrium tenue]